MGLLYEVIEIRRTNPAVFAFLRHDRSSPKGLLVALAVGGVPVGLVLASGLLSSRAALDSCVGWSALVLGAVLAVIEAGAEVQHYWTSRPTPPTSVERGPGVEGFVRRCAAVSVALVVEV
jgi:hypothetical protein